jgi:hypothetical protein
MGLFDTILGRTKPKAANLESLFALPSAAVTLQTAAGLYPTGAAGVCFKPPADREEADVTAEISGMLSLHSDGAASTMTSVDDAFGYRWLVVHDQDLSSLVTAVHVINSSLNDHGWGPQLLCSAFAFAPGAGADSTAKAVTLVYLFKRGSFYPFCQVGHEQRDTTTELHVKALLGSDLPVEEDLTRWMALWDLPLA